MENLKSYIIHNLHTKNILYHLTISMIQCKMLTTCINCSWYYYNTYTIYSMRKYIYTWSVVGSSIVSELVYPPMQLQTLLHHPCNHIHQLYHSSFLCTILFNWLQKHAYQDQFIDIASTHQHCYHNEKASQIFHEIFLPRTYANKVINNYV